MFVSNALCRLQVEAQKDVHDVIFLNFHSISIQGMFITAMNPLHIHYTNIEQNNKHNDLKTKRGRPPKLTKYVQNVATETT